MIYDFKKIEIRDINGVILIQDDSSKIYKVLANFIYFNAHTIDMVLKAIEINKGNEVELDASEVEDIKNLIINGKFNVFAFIKKEIINFLDDNNGNKT
jgi:hypothetical protein